MLISVRKLSVGFGERSVLTDINFDVNAGEIVGIHAPSGCGKSTLAAALTGLLPQHARVSIEHGALPKAGGQICLMSQHAQHALNPARTVGQWLSRIRPLRCFQSLKALSHQLFDSSEWNRVVHSLPGELSGGMRQRALLVGLLHRAPDVLVCDEPVSAQDAECRERMESVLRAFTKDQRAVIWLSHEPLERLASRQFVLQSTGLNHA